MHWKWLGVCFFVFGNLVADEDEFIDLHNDSGPMFVSLGCNCEISMQLRDNHLRKCAFPFDWVFIFDQDKFNALLDDDFECFLDKNFLMQYPILINQNQAVNIDCGIEFTHDNLSLENWEEEKVQATLAKYARRIDRFRQLRHYPGKVIFLHHPFNPVSDGVSDLQREWWLGRIKKTDEGQVQELKDALDRYFPDLDFILVVVNHLDEETILTEEIPGVHEFKARWFHRDDDYRLMLKLLQTL